VSRRVLWGARFVLLAVASGAVLLGIAMALYPGGTALDAHAPGHSFWLNFLCDLTAGAARNGVANPAGSLVARAAMLALSLALGATWLVVPSFVSGQRALARAIRVAGVLCVTALVAVPLLPGIAHAVAIFTAAGAGLGAGLATVVALARSHGPARRWLPLAAVLAATAADSLFYAQAVHARPLPPSPALPAFQRVGLLLALAWMVATALELLLAARPRDQAAGRGGRS
jgi:hypothetical protein